MPSPTFDALLGKVLFHKHKATDITGLSSGSPGGSTGQLQFNDAGSFGGDSVLVWDSTNKRLGVGAASPAQVGHFAGSETGGTGVNLLVENTATTGQPVASLVLKAAGANKGSMLGCSFTNGSYGIQPGVVFSPGADTDNISFRTGAALNGLAAGPQLSINASGYVGVNVLGTGTGGQLHVQSSGAAVKTVIVRGYASQTANTLEVQDSGGTAYYTVGGKRTMDTNADTGFTVNVRTQLGSAGQTYGMQITNTAVGGTSGTIAGFTANANGTAAATLLVSNQAACTVTAGTSTQAQCFRGGVAAIGATAVIGTAFGLSIQTPFTSSGGSVINVYGIKVEDQTGGTSSNYALYTGTGAVRFGDTVTAVGNITGANLSGTNTGDQLVFKTISVSGQSDVVADTSTDTLTLVAGTNVTITTDAATDSITINATGGGSASKYVGRVLKTLPPGSSYATFDTRAGGSTPPENVEVMDFDDTTIEYMDFMCRLDGYNGGGLTVGLPWSATTATTGDVVWEVAIRRLQDDAEDIDTAQTYDFNSVTDTCASASGEQSYPTITFTNGADMDSWADGELAIVRVRRNASSVSDTMTGDAELWAISIKET